MECLIENPSLAKHLNAFVVDCREMNLSSGLPMFANRAGAKPPHDKGFDLNGGQP